MPEVPAPLLPALPILPEALSARPRRPKRSKPWFEEVFDEDYLRTLPFLRPDQTLREVEFVAAALNCPAGGELLDIGCGYGRHAIELVQRGFNVTGLDLSLPLLIRAADEAQRRALSVNFVHADMREMAFEQQFDGAYCMLTSFGYFDEEANLRVAERIARALKPGARLLLDIVNRDYMVGTCRSGCGGKGPDAWSWRRWTSTSTPAASIPTVDRFRRRPAAGARIVHPRLQPARDWPPAAPGRVSCDRRLRPFGDARRLLRQRFP